MKNKYILSILYSFFIIVMLIYLANLYHCAQDCHAYIIADWLINFQAGFVRRGLGGQVILFFSDLIDIPANFVVMSIQITFYLAYMFLLFFLMKKKEINIWFIILLLSPGTLLFPIWDVAGLGRKEIILFVIFGLYILCLNKGMLKSTFFITTFSILLLIATFFHELTFFYTPYFLLAGYIKAATNKQPFHLKKYSFVILGSLLAMIPIYFYGKSINSTVLCEGLLQRGLDHKVCEGVLEGIEYSIPYVLNEAQKANYFWSYGIALLLGLIPFIGLVKCAEKMKTGVKKFLLVFLFLFLFSTPLFLLAFDWGRWINIHFTMLLFTSTLLLKDKLNESEWNNKIIELPRLWKSETPFFKASSNVLILIICFCYVYFWQMRHFAAFPVFCSNKYEIFEREINKSIDIGSDIIYLTF